MQQQDGRLKYSELDHLVKLYQEGDNEAAMGIITAFSGYLTRFVSLIKYGNIDLSSASQRQFAALFIRNRYERLRVLRGTANDGMRRLAYSTAAVIANQFKPYSEEDIRAELITELLVMAKHYKNDRGHFFHTYVSKAFAFRIFKRLTVWINDLTNIIARNTDRPNIDVLEERDFADDLVDSLRQEDALLLVPDNDDNQKMLDENWISGFTCSDLFNRLTPLERRVLVMYYQDGYKNREISAILGHNIAAVQKIRIQAIAKLRN